MAEALCKAEEAYGGDFSIPFVSPQLLSLSLIMGWWLIYGGCLFVEDSKHPTVGVVLASTGLMYRRKAIQEHSSALLIQEVITLQYMNCQQQI